METKLQLFVSLIRSTIRTYRETRSFARLGRLRSAYAACRYFVTGDTWRAAGKFRARHYVLWSSQTPRYD